MTDNNHLITPPHELVEQWLNAPRYAKSPKNGTFVVQKCHSLSESEVIALVENAARWGADTELDACCSWVSQFDYDDYSYAERLRGVRRGRTIPPSLKAQALALLDDASDRLDAVHENIIRRALEQLDDRQQPFDYASA